MHQTPAPGSASVRLRTEKLRQLAEANGLGSDGATVLKALAAHTGLDNSTWSRLLRHDTLPGNKIIASLLLAFPDQDFTDLFEIRTHRVRRVVFEDDEEQAAA